MSIRLIVGLGNPGLEYEKTRHNAGFWCVNALLHHFNGAALQKDMRAQALIGKINIGVNVVWLMQPQTYMNCSGKSVAYLAQFYKIPAHEILVVHDELDFLPGVARLKLGGSAGGHNGLKDISAKLGSQAYWRLRIGIGHPRESGSKQSVADFVLHRAPQKEEELIFKAIEKSIEIIPLFCEGQFAKATMQFHQE
jgi:PTH1 family peptidyl-tRNA hydrolase